MRTGASWAADDLAPAPEKATEIGRTKAIARCRRERGRIMEPPPAMVARFHGESGHDEARSGGGGVHENGGHHDVRGARPRPPARQGPGIARLRGADADPTRRD